MFTGEQEQKYKRQFHWNCQGLFNQINPWDWIVPQVQHFFLTPTKRQPLAETI